MSKTRAKAPPRRSETLSHKEVLAARNPAWTDLAISMGILLSVLVAYAQVGHFDFVNYDDNLNVYDNAYVKAGLTSAGIQWALTAVVAGTWSPLTLFSHMLDVQMFGLKSGPEHFVNVFVHALSAIVLFWVLKRATKMRWAAAFVAAVFALHPVHVGSVAWISERKDVLSALFWILALGAYVRYTERPGSFRYLLLCLAFLLGLMSKPMVVTLPLTLLLFDIWPLRRYGESGVPWGKLIAEKLPLVAISAVASIAILAAQQSAGALKPIAFALRAQNAANSYVTYIGQMFWPTGLTVFYPFPDAIPVWQTVAALGFIGGVTVVCLRIWRVHPWLLVGWLWYLVTLLPVIGLVQAGSQAHADRYDYVPMIGLSLMISWGAVEAIARWPSTRSPAIAAAVLCCIAMTMDTRAEAAYWENSEALFTRNLEVARDNLLAEFNLGVFLMGQPGRVPAAIPRFEAALRLSPDDPGINEALGECLANVGRDGEAVSHFEAALRVDPGAVATRIRLADALAKLPSRREEAASQYERVLRSQPENEQAHSSLAVVEAQLGRMPEAISHLETAVKLRPDYRAEFNLGAILARIPGRQAESIAHLEAARRLQPDPQTAQMINNLLAALKQAPG